MGSMSEIVSSALSFIDSGDILYTLRICNLNERCAGISYSTTIDAKARARQRFFFYMFSKRWKFDDIDYSWETNAMRFGCYCVAFVHHYSIRMNTINAKWTVN